MTLHISAGRDIDCAFSFLFCEFNSAPNAERSQAMPLAYTDKYEIIVLSSSLKAKGTEF